MSDLTSPADKLAEVNDRLVANGRKLSRDEQLVEARRHSLWAARWLNLANSQADPSGDTTLPEAARAIRRGRALIEQAIP